MMEKISIRIDDQDIVAKEGSTILEVALSNKIFIPHLCYHPDLKTAGACRVCLVEMENGQIVTSCRTPIKKGMVIKTKSPEVDRVRRPLIEMIIANHHMDCRNCLKKGQCGLQKIMAYMKIDKKRIQETLRLPKVELPLDESNPFFIRDHNKCILCGICVRTCQKIARINAIEFSGRGNNTKIATFADKPIADSICVSCGECVIRCPVGALVVKKPQRPAQEVKTICPYCSVGCGLFLGIRDGTIVNVRADNENPVNKGHLCVRGRYGLGFVHSTDRLKEPLMRQGTGTDNPPCPPLVKGGEGGFVEISWDEALTVVAKKLKKYKGEEIAVIASTRCTNEENYIAQKFARVAMGSNNIDTSVRLYDAPSIAALIETNSIGMMTNQIDNIEKAACILVVGANITRSHPVMGIKIKKAVEKGTNLIVISPKETDLCRYAHLRMNPYPGTDLALIMGMCNMILEEELHDNLFIEKHADNFEAFKESLEDFSLGRVERITGVSKDMIEKAARVYGESKPSTIIWDSGVTQFSQGTNNILSIINLSILTGNIDRPSSLIPLWGQNNALGASTMGCLPDFYPGFQPVADTEIAKKFENIWGQTLNPKPGLTLTEILNATRKGNIKALYIVGVDLVKNMAPTKKVKEALKKAKFIVFQDIFLNETAKFAHVILPAASFAEKDGTFTNTERRNQIINRAIDPVGSSQPDWKILCELAKRLKIDGFAFNGHEEIMSEISSVVSGMPLQRKKFRFTSLQYKPPAEVTDIDYPLILITDTDIYSCGSISKKVEGLEILRTKDLVSINPKDATDFEIEDGTTVKIISRHGNIKGIAKITRSVPSGLVSMYLEQEKMNQLIDPALDPVAKTPEMKICAVKIIAQKGYRLD
jgi:formate dehydrogenase alpha subunit